MASRSVLTLVLALLVVASAATTELWVSAVVGAAGNVAGCGAQAKPCGTIKFAMEQVTSGPIEIVLLHGYTYSDPGDMNIVVKTQNVSMRPDDAVSPTIVDCRGSSRFMQVINEDRTGALKLEVAFHALTFTGCVAPENSNGAVLQVSGLVNVIITDSNFNQNRARNGGAISVVPAVQSVARLAPTVRLNGDNVFYNNSATNNGGAIYSESSYVDISGATFQYNRAVVGGAIWYSSNFVFSMNGGSFSFNRALSSTDAGSALYISSAATVAVQDVTFTSNHAMGKGTIMFYFGPRATLQAVTFIDNTALGGGAGIAESAQVTGVVEDSLFVNNRGLKGSAIMVSGSSKLTASRLTCRSNHAAFGGCLYFQSSSGTVSATTFDGNLGEDGAAVYASIHCSVTIKDSVIRNNVATQDGAGMFCDQSTYTLTNNTFSNNTISKTRVSSKDQDVFCDTEEANGFCTIEGDPIWKNHCKLTYDSGKVPLPKWLIGTLIGLGVFIFFLILAVAFWMYQVRRKSRASTDGDNSHGDYAKIASSDDGDESSEGPRTTQLWGVVTNPNEVHYADESEDDDADGDGLVEGQKKSLTFGPED